MKLKNKSKILILSSIFVLITSMIISISFVEGTSGHIITSDYGDYNLDDYQNDTIQIKYEQLFNENDNMYCLEHGVDITSRYYKVSNAITVTDPTLLYILNLPDKPKGVDKGHKINNNFIEVDVKQNLIWWYLSNSDENESFENILSDNIGGFAFKGSTDPTLPLPLEENEYIDIDSLGNINIIDNRYWYYMALGTTPDERSNRANEINNDYETKRQAAINYANEYNSSGSISIKTVDIQGNYVNVSVEGTFDKYEIYINENECYGEYDKNDTEVRIPLTEFEGNTVNVEVKGYKEKYKATIYILAYTNNQRLMAIFDTGTELEDVGSDDGIIQSATNISLQKYITQVNGKDITETDTSLTERKNKRTSTNETNSGVKDKIYKKSIREDQYATDSYKKSDPVKIAVGDTVTYRIYIYKNSEVAPTNIKIRDRIPTDYAEIISFKLMGIQDVIDHLTYNDNDNVYEISLSNIWANNSVSEYYIDVTLRFNKYSNNILTNTAWIYDTTPDNDTDYRTVDRDYVEMIKPNISLQKYILKVDDVQIAASNSRRNKKTSTDEAEGGVKDNIYYDTNSKKVISATDSYKKSDPVNIEVGNTVTYRIRVYNNSKAKANTITVKDLLPGYKTSTNGPKTICVSTDLSDISIVKKGGTTITPTVIDGKELNWTITNLAGNSDTYFDVTLKFNKYSSAILGNTAYVTEIEPTNENTYRTVDRDYVQMATYSVKLEKYVSAVKSAGVTTNVTVRENHPIYDQNGYSKESNPVRIEVGDEVTYTIKLTNTGDRPIKVTQIIDTFDGNDNANLQYRDASTDNGTLSVNNNTPGELIFNISDQKPIDPGKSVFLTLSFIVDVSEEHTNLEQTLVNTAIVTQITNSNNEVVSDNTTDDNEDSDWIETKTYAVSLEKYVTKVTDKDGKNEVLYTERENHPIYEQNDYSKESNPVQVEPGDIVTFRIKLQNERETQVKVTKIYDTVESLSSGLGLKLANNNGNTEDLQKQMTFDIYKYDSSSKNTNKIDGKKAILDTEGKFTNDNKLKTDWDSYNRYKIDFDGVLLDEDDYIYIDVKFKVMVPKNLTASEQTLYNKAAILELENRNDCQVKDSDGTTNNEDKDWVKTKLYAVSLEKYVTEVTDGAGKNAVTYNDRSGKPKYSTEDGTWKEEHPVELEVGDIVTYRIRLKNEGDTQVKITKIYDTAEFKSSTGVGLKLADNNGNTEGLTNTISLKIYKDGKESKKTATINTSGDFTYNDTLKKDFDNYKRYEINFTDNNAVLLAEDEYIEVEIKFEVEVAKAQTASVQELYNKAVILELENRNDCQVKDSDGTTNNEDHDYIKTKLYAISLEKYVSAVNGTNIDDNRSGKAEYLTKDGDKYVDNTSGDSVWTSHNTAKYDDVVTVGNGDYVTYAIKVTNDGETSVKINEIKDILPSFGKSKYRIGGYNNGKEYTDYNSSSNETTINRAGAILLGSGESTTVYVTVEVNESNISLRTITNTAKVDGFINRNSAEVLDSTPYNNEDSDYINLKDINISGVVWNDRAFDKNALDYNGLYDSDKEIGISGIKVELYDQNNTANPVATTTTGENGQYSFIGTENMPIKASKLEGKNRWDSYKSYYIKYVYDGITYTSTKVGDDKGLGIYNDIHNDSNAQETLDDRKYFNDNFNPINNGSGIEYTTKNEDGYIPQSNHIYDPDKMAIRSTTSLVNIGHKDITEEKLQHINLGLRGRDTFDLELTDDIYSTRVTVNDVKGAYNYNNNNVTIRHEDIKIGEEIIVDEDAANIANHTIESTVSEENQNVRETDILQDKKLKIEVTYKLTIKNASKTAGTATKVIDYYDDKYKFREAYDDLGNTLGDEPGESGTGFKSVIITTDGRNLSGEDNTMEIYVVFELNNAYDLLSGLKIGDKIATYNIAEIYEYTTSVGEGQTEFTRGLIDVDSAPGSANKEKVRLTTPTTDGDTTTIKYYFNKKLEQNENNPEYLKALKYEDDTYTAPILYFVVNGNQRVIKGVVFEDKTSVDPATKIKTGNGKLDKNEVGVYGARVKLIEQKENGKTYGPVETDKDGKFEFTGFIPGNYIIRYSYGDTTKTVLLHQNETVNKQSYNGEDYQSTNNTGKMGDSLEEWLYKLNGVDNYWYVYNEKEGISTATDNSGRREYVSGTVADFSDDQMAVLNNMRDLVGAYDANTNTLTATQRYNMNKTELMNLDSAVTVTGIKEIMNETYMFADTESMLFTVEKTYLDGDNLIQRDEFGEYNISNMNFGIAEVPVTTIDLQKEIQGFTIKDAAGKNVIASLYRDENGEWKFDETVGSVIPLENSLSVSIEDEKLQGARLEITFNVKADMEVERNFDNTESKVPTIEGMVDFINNNLSYNSSLGENSKYWEVTDNSYLTSNFEGKHGTVENSGGNLYTVKVKATSDNPLAKATEGTAIAPIVLERILTSTDSTIEEIITSTVDTFEYSNIVEIVKINYNELSRDRVRNPERYIIIPGQQYDSAESTETLVIHPPTGASDINIVYYVIALVSLVILAGGIIGIKKFVIKK